MPTGDNVTKGRTFTGYRAGVAEFTREDTEIRGRAIVAGLTACYGHMA